MRKLIDVRYLDNVVLLIISICGSVVKQLLIEVAKGVREAIAHVYHLVIYLYLTYSIHLYRMIVIQ